MSKDAPSPGSPNHADPEAVAAVSDSDGEIELPDSQKLSAKDIERMRNMTMEDIKKVDDLAKEAIRAFFDNRVEDTETLLTKDKDRDPIMTLGLGLVCFLRYGLSMEQAMADTALRTVSEASAFAAQLYPSSGNFMTKGFSKMGGAFRKKKDPRETWLTPAEFRHKSIHAMAQGVRTFCLILEQSVSSVVKAGFALNRANKDLVALVKERSQRLEVLQTESFDEIELDPNTPYNVEYVMGCITTVVAILPSSVRSLLSLFGVNGDRDKGLEMIYRCRDSHTLLAPFASATLLAFEGVLPSVCALAVNQCLPHVRQLSEEVLSNEVTRNSLLHRWLIARVHRLTRDIPGSSARLQECVDLAVGAEQVNRTMPQLRNFVRFDQGWSFLLARKWSEALSVFEELVRDSDWSDMFYIYAQGCCYEMMAFDARDDAAQRQALLRKASERYWTAMHQKQMKLGGKVMRVDQLTLARLVEMMKSCGREDPNPAHKEKLEVTNPLPEDVIVQNACPLVAYELHILFSLTHQMDSATAARVVGDAERVAAVELEEARTRAAEDPALGGHAVEVIAKALLKDSTYNKVKGTPMTAKMITTGKSKPRAFNRMLSLAAIKAFHQSNDESDASVMDSLALLDAILAGPKYADKECSFSFIVPFALYEKASAVTRLSGAKAGEEWFDKYKKEYGSSRYYYHSLTENKVHLAKLFASQS